MNALFKVACTERGLDNAMSLIQFTSLALTGPARQAGHISLAKSLSNATRTADTYRAVTRLSLLLEALSPSTLAALQSAKQHRLIRSLDVVNHAILIAYCVFEHLAVLGGFNVLPSSLVRLDGCAVVCWFYNLLLDAIRAAALLCYGTRMGKLSPPERREQRLKLIHSLCFLVFSVTCLPEEGPQMLSSSALRPGGAGATALVALHHAMRTVTPQRLVLSSTTRGLLGLVGTIATFL